MTPRSTSRARPALAGLVLAAACHLTAPPALAQAASEPPVPLRTPSFITPAEMAGSGLAPEVKVRARIDDRGRVGEIEVLAIQPSSRYDEPLRRVTVETLERWRYAPAREDGVPVASPLELTVRFQASQDGGYSVDAASDWMWLGLVPDDDLPPSRVYTLPRQEQEELLRRYSGVAERQVEATRRRQVATPRFVVVSDAEEPRVAEVVAGNLEATFNVLDRMFRPGIEAQPAHYKSLAYVYFERRAFSAAVAETLRPPEWADGLYAAPGFLAFHLEARTPEEALSTLLHEAAHAYTERHLFQPGFEPPLWLVEGFAEYLANSEIRNGELIPGRTQKRRLVLDLRAGGAYRIKTRAGWSLDDVKKVVRQGEAPGLEELIAADRAVFYGENVGLHYAMSWLFVHFLRHGEPGWAEREFPALLLYVAEGYPATEALEAIYGRTPAAMNGPFREHLKRF